MDPWVGKIAWRRKWQPTSGFLPRELHRERSLVGYSPWGLKESDTTERLAHSCFRAQTVFCLLQRTESSLGLLTSPSNPLPPWWLYSLHLAAFPSGSALKWQNMRRNYISISIDEWLPRWLSSKEYACQCRRCKFDPWVRKMLWSRIWQPAPVFLPGKFHGQRRLAGYSPQGSKELDMTPLLSTHTPHTKLWRKI